MNDAYETGVKAPPIPNAFIGKRLHSLTGLFLVLFLFEHLFTNSQAALFIGDDGLGFVQAVNWLHSLPYLPVIELTLLGFPFVFHGIWGIQSLFSAKVNSFRQDGATPALQAYSRNQAYTWQRISALILVVGLFFHVTTMRFLHYPSSEKVGHHTQYSVKVTMDPGLESLASRFNCTLLSKGEELVAVTDDFGTALLFSVRDAFKSVWTCILYTFFVLAACFHAMNGVWSFAITWGFSVSERARQGIRRASDWIMLLIFFLGFAAIWGTYWVNLRS